MSVASAGIVAGDGTSEIGRLETLVILRQAIWTFAGYSIPTASTWEGCTLHAPGGAVRKHRRTTHPWRITPSICANLSSRKAQPFCLGRDGRGCPHASC